MNCDEVRVQLLVYSMGELSFEDEDALESHLAICEGCRAEKARVESYESLMDAHGEAEIPVGLLAKCRRDLSARLDAERSSPIRAFSFGKVWRNWVVNPPMWLRPVGAIAMLAIGFGLARYAPGNLPQFQIAGGSADPASRPALQKVRLVDPGNEGQVRVLFDEVRQREVTGYLNDDHIRRLLLAGVNDPNDPGLRVESINLLKDDCTDDEVRGALLNRLQNDPNSGVRLKALEALKPFSKEPETRKVLAQVLLTDDNPGVRTQVIELLASARAPEMAGILQELLQKEQNGYVRSMSQRALREMKASQGTF